MLDTKYIDKIVLNYNRIIEKIRITVDTKNIPKVMIVTKGQSEEVIKELQKRIKNPIFGENRVNELARKIDICGSYNTSWHFIGHLQRNKVKKVIGKIDLLQSLDSLNLAIEINKRAKHINTIINCLIQIDICQDGSKFGISPDLSEISALINAIGQLRYIKINGLMTIAPYIPSPKTKKYFQKMQEIYHKIALELNLPSNVKMEILSMGMSNDYITAIENGSNMVRIGSAIFKETQKSSNAH